MAGNCPRGPWKTSGPFTESQSCTVVTGLAASSPPTPATPPQSTKSPLVMLPVTHVTESAVCRNVNFQHFVLNWLCWFSSAYPGSVQQPSRIFQTSLSQAAISSSSRGVPRSDEIYNPSSRSTQGFPPTWTCPENLQRRALFLISCPETPQLAPFDSAARLPTSRSISKAEETYYGHIRDVIFRSLPRPHDLRLRAGNQLGLPTQLHNSEAKSYFIFQLTSSLSDDDILWITSQLLQRIWGLNFVV